MILHTQVRDCLYLNWALPAERLPEPPEPLRYDTREKDGESVVFASALFFRHGDLRFSSLPIPGVDAPQFQLHLCTLDGDGVPSVLIRAVLVPGWFAAGARLFGRQPAQGAQLAFPASTGEAAAWTWEVRRGTRLVVQGEIGPPTRCPGPDLGTWNQTVSFFRRRGLGFTESMRGLRRIEIERSNADVTPIRATVAENALLLRYLKELSPLEMPELHSAWLCAPMQVSYELSGAPRSAVGTSLPAPG